MLLNKLFVDQYKNKQTPFWNHGLGEFVYMRTYSRIKDNGENEKWYETIERVINGVFLIKKTHFLSNNIPWDIEKESNYAEEMYDLFFNIKVLPGGRSLWAMGTKITTEKKLYAALNNCANITTANIDKEYSKPFEFLFDACMLGIGVGFDTDGSNKIIINKPVDEIKIHVIEDSREGWVKALKKTINQYLKKNKKTIMLDYSQIRPKGIVLKTFGGTSSGSESLNISLTSISNMLKSNINKNITSKIIVNIMNLICLCVISGNIRRSASIAVGDPKDNEFINLKNYEINPERISYGWLSNNSIRATIGMDYTDIVNNIGINGEPGILWLDNMKEYSRMSGIKDYKDIKVTAANPCFTKDTYLLTDRGNITFSDIIKNTEIVNNTFSQNKIFSYINVWDGVDYIPAKIQYHNKSVIYKISFNNGIILKCTPNHKFYILNNNKYQEIEANELKTNDIMYYNKYENCMNSSNINCTQKYTINDVEYNELIIDKNNYETKLLKQYNISLNDKIVYLSEILKNQTTSYIIKKNSILIKYNNVYGDFNDMYYYLLSVGVICSNKQEDDNYVIIKIHGDNIRILNNYLIQYTHFRFKNIRNIVHYDKKVKIVNIEKLNIEEDVYCVETLNINSKNSTHRATFNGIIASNCSEISLEPYELCNLVEIFINRHDTYEEFEKSLHYAFMYGKIVSLCETHWEESNKIIKQNRRVGCSLTGIVNFIENKGIDKLHKWTNNGYTYLRTYDNILSNLLLVNKSIKITCIKPSGTISLLVPDTCPGIHYPVSRYYIRRIRINNDSIKLINSITKKGYNIEKSETEPNTQIINFPIDNHCIRTVNDVTLWEQLELASKLQEWWSDNQVSCTITFDKETEFKDLKYAIELYQYKLKGISFLPTNKKQSNNEFYSQMPYEKINDVEYNSLIKNIKHNELLEIDENTQEEEIYCTTDTCLMNYKVNKKNIIFMNGVTGSGKSFLAKTIQNYLQTQNIKLYILTKDDYRYVNSEYVFTKEYELIVEQKYFNKLDKLLSNNKYKYIILDNTHINNTFVAKTLNKIKYKDNCIMVSIYPYSNINKHLERNVHINDLDPIRRQIKDWNTNYNLYNVPIILNTHKNDNNFSSDEINEIIYKINNFFK